MRVVLLSGQGKSVPGIEQFTRKTTGNVNDQILTMPDFIVQDDRNSRLHFVEVKYRANGKFKFTDVRENYPWPSTYFIIVSKEHIKCLTYEQLEVGESISPTCNNLLIVRKDLDLDRKKIVQYASIAKKFFTGV